jgi:hypothetical protein
VRKKSKWCHHKYPNREYVGSYETITLADKVTKKKFKQRLFILTAKLKNGKPHSVEFGDSKYAKAEGWIKL